MSRGLIGNIAKRGQQFNLLGERRKSEGKKGRIKKETENQEEKGGKREKEGVEKRFKHFLKRGRKNSGRLCDAR